MAVSQEEHLKELSKGYPKHHLIIVLDGAPSHRSEQITHPENISLLMLPPYSPELDPSEAGEVVPRVQAKVVKQDLRDGRRAARGAYPDACALLGEPRPPQTPHRLLLVDRSRGGVVTLIARNGIIVRQPRPETFSP